MRFSRRLDPLPEYLTARTNRIAAERRAAGHDVISLGVGDPDLPPTPAARRALAELVERDDVHGYPTNRGLPVLREAVARFYMRRFGVELDPEREIVPVLGAKEALAHLALAQLDAGDAALVADPGYPVYVGGPVLAGAEPIGLPLLRERYFLPDLDAVAPADRARANLLLIGYPNNPTGTVVDVDFHAGLAAWALTHDVPVCHDNAYSELAFAGRVAPSFLQADGARQAGIELFSLSKAHGVPGWRIAFAVGNAAMVGNLLRLKTQVDAGMFMALQRAAIHLLEADPAQVRALAQTYERRCDAVCRALAAAGLDVPRPGGGMYVWMPVPGGDDVGFAERLLAEHDVIVSPGSAYGAAGAGYVRLALIVGDDRLAEAARRIVQAL